MCEYSVYAQCVQLGMPRSRFIALEGRLMNCLHGLPLQYLPSLLLIDVAFMYMITNLSATDLIYLQNKIIAESLENFQLEL
jgi:hypothetical protein